MDEHAFARWIAKVEVDANGCWLWTAYSTRDGYGRFNLGGMRGAHRVSYEHFVGPIPPGLELDHLCRVRRCVNPDHLEPVTLQENQRRSERATKTHCKNGHAFDEANTYLGDGRRQCRACNRAAVSRYKSRTLAA